MIMHWHNDFFVAKICSLENIDVPPPIPEFWLTLHWMLKHFPNQFLDKLIALENVRWKQGWSQPQFHRCVGRKWSMHLIHFSELQEQCDMQMASSTRKQNDHQITDFQMQFLFTLVATLKCTFQKQWLLFGTIYTRSGVNKINCWL